MEIRCRKFENRHQSCGHLEPSRVPSGEFLGNRKQRRVRCENLWQSKNCPMITRRFVFVLTSGGHLCIRKTIVSPSGQIRWCSCDDRCIGNISYYDEYTKATWRGPVVLRFVWTLWSIVSTFGTFSGIGSNFVWVSKIFDVQKLPDDHAITQNRIDFV